MARKKILNKKMLVSIFIIAIMVLSAFGFMLSYQTSQPEKLEDYNGFSFAKTPQGYKTEINEKDIYFNYYPGDLESLNVSEEAKNVLSNTKAIFVTYDPNSAFAAAIAEIQFDMEQKLAETGVLHMAKGLTNATEYALPQITCNNATAAMPVLYMKRGKKSEITASNNCVTLTALTERDLNAFYTRVIYTLFDVMK